MTMEMICHRLLLVILVFRLADSVNTIKYENFEDYLMTISNPNEIIKSETESLSDNTNTSMIDSNNGPDGDVTNITYPVIDDGDIDEVTDLDILKYFREVPREHWSCCMLGKLAGDKGFHCHAGFYRERIQFRNSNRAHNARLLFSGPNPIPGWGRNTMLSFARCVSRHSDDFHKCCYAAALEHQERRRWKTYRSGEVADGANQGYETSPRTNFKRSRRNGSLIRRSSIRGRRTGH